MLASLPVGVTLRRRSTVAGHAGAIDVAERVLEEGIDLYLLSVGILSDNPLRHRLVDVAKASGASIVIPAGALAGFDGLAAIARIPGTAVTYTSIKPCSAWRGTPAEDAVDLDVDRRRSVILAEK